MQPDYVLPSTYAKIRFLFGLVSLTLVFFFTLVSLNNIIPDILTGLALFWYFQSEYKTLYKTRLCIDDHSVYGWIKGEFRIDKDSIQAVILSRFGKLAFIEIYTDDRWYTFSLLDYRYKDLDAFFKRHFSNDRYSNKTRYSLPYFSDSFRNLKSSLFKISRPLTVFYIMPIFYLGFVTGFIGLTLAVVFMLAPDQYGFLAGSLCLLIPSAAMMVPLVGKITGDMQSIKLSLLFHTHEIPWYSLKKVEVSPTNRMIALTSDSCRICIPYAHFWKGKDRDDLYALLNLKWDELGIVPGLNENQDFLFSRNF